METSVYLQVMDLLMQAKNPDLTEPEVDELWMKVETLTPVAALVELRRIANMLEKLNETIKHKPIK